MNHIATCMLSTCLSLSTVTAFAQDAAPKSDAKAKTAAQDCKDHANTATGEKRTDPATPDSGAGCAIAPKMTKKHSAKKGSALKGSASAPAGSTN